MISVTENQFPQIQTEVEKKISLSIKIPRKMIKFTYDNDDKIQ